MAVFLCGLLSGSTFLLAAYSQQGGILPLFLPALPLAFLGLSISSSHSLGAAIVAAVLAGLMIDSGGMLFMAAFLLIPTCHFLRKALLWRGEDREREWYPVLTIISDLTLMAAGIFVLLVLTIHFPEHTDLKMLLSQSIQNQLKDMVDMKDPNMENLKQFIMSDWALISLALLGSWLWVLTIYGMILAVNMFLNAYGMALRPSLALAEKEIPAWLPAVMLVSMALALLGKGNDRLTGEAVFMIMLLPYFLSGLVSLHRVSHAWNNRLVWLVLAYAVLIFLPPWGGLLVAARGMYMQMEALLKRFTQDNSH